MDGREAPALAAIVEKGEVCIGAEVLERLSLAAARQQERSIQQEGS